MGNQGRVTQIARALLAFSAIMGAHTGASAEPIRMQTWSIPLNAGEPEERRVGEMTFLGGLELRSPAEGFGGFSGLHISPDGGKMIAVSDMGYWLEADLVHSADGALTGARNARLAPMLGLDGKPITGKALGDAEELAVTPDGILVSFERRHRVWRYPHAEDLSTARPAAIPMPDDLASIENNKGLESLVPLPGGKLLLLTEETLDDEGHIRGWLGAADAWAPLRVRRSPPFAVTAAALLPGNGELLILERRYSTIGGLGIKLRRVPVSAVAPGALITGTDVAEFAPGQNIDNFEGMAARPDGTGGAIVYLLSDDNFNGFQRTLLLNFRLDPSVSAAH